MATLPACCIPNKFKPVTHCIFDLDGTILETETIYSKAINSILQEYDQELTKEYHTTITGLVEKDLSIKMVKDFDLPITPDEFVTVFRERSDSFLQEAEFMPGAVDLLQHLHAHRIPLAIGTSSGQYAVDLKFSNKKEIFDLFSHVVCGGSDPEVLEGKPAPDIFIVAARRFPDRPSPSKCLVFEDAVNGVKAALAAKMQVVMIPAPEVPYDCWKLATLRLDSLKCMVPELFGLPAFNAPLPEENAVNENDGMDASEEAVTNET
ncbi:probable pseudouridine-5'-phosphatase [Diorhabda sublineata]|uniref:probable pseudouridine-5'-phosphatase n=1 Tax=Diorhabda sublineata TaxID=1163346 RepID=UPI0024E0E8FF|nr:probable pseudouridine-5'-phosphatase [Diorhabda sublineata]